MPYCAEVTSLTSFYIKFDQSAKKYYCHLLLLLKSSLDGDTGLLIIFLSVATLLLEAEKSTVFGTMKSILYIDLLVDTFLTK